MPQAEERHVFVWHALAQPLVLPAFTMAETSLGGGRSEGNGRHMGQTESNPHSGVLPSPESPAAD